MNTNLNMNFSERIVVKTEEMDWVDTRLPDVRRRMLEREAAESGRATTIVQYAAGAEFSAHVHTGGEEYIVLEGIFSDDYGDFGPGMYVRNPVGSKHRPYSKDGCTIFVKLGQMDPLDQHYARIDTNNSSWLIGQTSGLSVVPLHQRGSENVALVKWSPGTRFQRHFHPGGEEILVLDGVFEDEQGRYPKGTWIRNPAGSLHVPFSEKGCTIYVRTGHLEAPATAEQELK